MSPKIAQAPLSQPKTRRRAATERSKSSRASSLSSQAMSPPSIPVCPDLDPGNQAAGMHARARATSGPLRQPKPLSPSDIHSILEQEQEAMVNRLSRELSLLRHQTSSVASTASSTSTTLNDDTLHGSPYMPGPIYPTTSRQHRSSSSLSGTYFPVIQESRTSGRSRRPSLVSPSPRSQSLISVTSQPQERRRDASAHMHSSRFPRRSSLSQQRIPSGSGSGGFPLDEMAPRGDVDSLLHENGVLRRRIRTLELELSVQKSQALSPKE
ncbi:uncharacterized protein BDV17DRAFT_121095 [Aspergillus undulatus]|uniref:uncharacterized protein n=1 Tax=Aspergillus undulatus TaxID=1810928 RepID=UPI003CCD9AEE